MSDEDSGKTLATFVKHAPTPPRHGCFHSSAWVSGLNGVEVGQAVVSDLVSTDRPVLAHDLAWKESLQTFKHGERGPPWKVNGSRTAGWPRPCWGCLGTQAQGGGERRACPLSLLVALLPRRSVIVPAQRARRWSDDRCPGAWRNNSVASGTFCPQENPARTCCNPPLTWHATSQNSNKGSGQLKPTRQTSEGVWSPFYAGSRPSTRGLPTCETQGNHTPLQNERPPLATLCPARDTRQ